MNNRAHPFLCPSRFYPILLIVGLFLMITILFLNDSNSVRSLKNSISRIKLPDPFPAVNLKEYKIKTYRGYVSMDELNENVFKKFGYEITRPTYPVPTVRMINEPTCVLCVAKISEQPQPKFPPKTIPAERMNEFLLYNYTALSDWYINDKNSEKGEKPRNWENLSELIKWPRAKLGGLAYGSDGVSIYDAMHAYRLDGKSGVVIGSMQPWVEVSALQSGASKVLTVEYNKLTIQEEFRDRMSSILPIDFVKNWRDYAGTFDFAASFSSIEHSGLGRYGDPVDPLGDLREMLKIKCVLKPGGLLFIGFPLGTDSIQYNAHRIYGSIRLAMMMYGFEWLDTFSGDKEEANDLTSDRLHSKPIFGQIQNTLVLRKL